MFLILEFLSVSFSYFMFLILEFSFSSLRFIRERA